MQVFDPDADSSLKVYYKFDDTPADGVEDTQNNYHSTAHNNVNLQSIPGKFGKSLDFDIIEDKDYPQLNIILNGDYIEFENIIIMRE